MSGLEILNSVRFVVRPDGHPSAVQLDIETWESLLDWLEDVEDRAAVKAALSRLREGPARSGALVWDDVAEEWDTDETELGA